MNQLINEIVNQMSIKLHLADLPIERVAFSYSVLYELLVSLRVLDDYKHHPLHINWAVETMKHLPSDFRAELRFFRVIIRECISLLWQSEYVEEPSYSQEIWQFTHLPLNRFIEPIIMFLTHDRAPEGQRKILNCPDPEVFLEDYGLQVKAKTWINQHYPDSLELVDILVADPQRLKQRFIEFIDMYWEAHFSEQWLALEGLFFQEVMQRGRLLYNAGVAATLKHLTPRTHIDDVAQTVTFVSSYENETLHLDEQSSLNLYPSYFLYPYMSFVLDNSLKMSAFSLSITYPMSAIQQAGRSPVLGEDLVAMLRALSDPTRLQIIKLIAKKARSTRELAEIIGISDAAISKHLKILQRNGWVTTQRSSYYVLYLADPERLTDLRYALSELFS